MAKGFVLIFLLASFLLLSRAEARAMPSESKSSSSSNTPTRSSSPEEASLDEDDCKGLNREECLMRRSMVAHTDYIYTQDISSTGP